MKLFPALLDRPEKVWFAEQESDEVIELLLRQHWVTNISWVASALLFLLLPLFFPLIAGAINVPLLSEIPPDLNLALIALWYMLVAAYIIEKLLYWYFNIYIVTNRHLVDVDFNSMLSHQVTEVRIEDMESISYKVKGLWGGIFYFGDVSAESAAKGQKIQFASIPRPGFVADRIQDLQDLLNKEGEDGS